MLDALLVVHLIGLMLGAGGGIGSMVTMRYAGPLPPEQAGVVRGLGPILARVALTGLIILWITGVAMVGTMGGDPSIFPWQFWAKMFFVGTLTISSIAIEITYAQLKRGNLKAAARLPVLGPISGISAVLAVTFAALAFH